MKTKFQSILSFFLVTAVMVGSVCALQPPAEQDLANQVTNDGKIRFSFQDQDWQEVIPWFADQAGYSLQPVSDWPEGTFSLQDDTEYTLLEALDQLNHALRLHKPDAYTLIRNRKMLILAKVEDADFPDMLIETVDVEELDNRGKYETIKCIFDLGELNAGDLFGQLDPMISRENRNSYMVIPAANQIHIRETGGRLRDIRDLIESARTRMKGDELTMEVYSLKHQDAETFMMIARGWLGIDEGKNRRADGMLSITPEPLGNRLYVLGTAKMLKRFEETIKTVDVPVDDDDGTIELDALYLKNYPIMSDPKLARQLIETMLEDHNGVKMDQDETTGAILVLGRAADHALVVESLATISGLNDGDFKIIPLKNGDPAEIIIVLQNLFRQTGEELTGPILMADSEMNHIIVRGTLQEVALVERMVAELDANAIPFSTGPRTRTRIVDMDQRDQDKILPILDSLLQNAGRENKLNIIMPEDRPSIRDRIRTTPSGGGLLNYDRPESRRFRFGNVLNEALFVLTHSVGMGPQTLSGLVMFQDEEDADGIDDKKQGYQPAVEPDSVSGAPIEIKFTRDTMILVSDDLDALDDLEQQLFLRLGEKSSVQLPFFFFLKHRPADEMKEFLEVFYGMSDGGGSGGGGGNLMTGMMNNMLGGGAGDLLGGLLGGGGGGGGAGASSDLEGDVRFGVDMPFNALYVAGATGNDIEEITMWIDALDRPDPPHNPELLGQFKTIDVLYRDPMELKELIEQQIPDLIYKAKEGGGGGNEQAAMQQMIKQMTGGGKSNGNSPDYEKTKPKAVIGVDTVTNQILVTGPEFIYREIEKRVRMLDVEEIRAKPALEYISGGNNSLGVQTVKEMFGDLIVLGNSEENEEGNSNPGSNPVTNRAKNQNRPGAGGATTMSPAMLQNILRASGQGGGGRGGGNRGGGGDRGGGGRGGRGGR